MSGSPADALAVGAGEPPFTSRELARASAEPLSDPSRRKSRAAAPSNAARNAHLRIAYLPEERLDNAYTLRMRELLSHLGTLVPYPGVKQALWGRRSRRVGVPDVLFLNWAENALVQPATGRLAWGASVKLFARTLAMRLTSQRLVYVRHNVFPHHCAPGARRAVALLAAGLERLCHVVVTHSGADLAAQRVYCPHPLYRRVADVADEADPVAAWGLPARYYVAFGRLLPYKQLDALIDGFPAEQTLVIAGAVGDANYVARLEAKQRPNVLVRPGYLSEGQAQRLVGQAAGLLLAHAEADVLVSGSFFYALSLGCPVHAVTTPFLRWVATRLDEGALRLYGDVRALGDGVRTSPAPVRPMDVSRIEHEFGDAAVRQALADLLGLGRPGRA